MALTVRTWSERLKVVSARIANAGALPLLAFMFWVIIFLLIIFATAEGKDSPFTAFFTAFGAVGQTFFAWMVWRLSRQQFEFAKRTARRQAQIDTYAHRVELHDRFLKLRSALTSARVTEEKVYALWDLQSQLERFFSLESMDAIDNLADKAMDLVDAKEDLREIDDKGLLAEMAAARQRINKINKEVRFYITRASNSMREELRISMAE